MGRKLRHNTRLQRSRFPPPHLLHLCRQPNEIPYNNNQRHSPRSAATSSYFSSHEAFAVTPPEAFYNQGTHLHSSSTARQIAQSCCHLPRAKMPGNRFRSQLKKIGNKTGHCLRTAAWQTCKCLIWTVCSPCICCIVLVLPNRSVIRESRVAMEPPKPMLPSPRRRALTLPSTDFQERQTTLDQTKSAFMTKLPLEIRRMIYGMALGEESIHLSLEDGNLKARRCSVTTCICYLRPHGLDYKLQLALPLLRTCRRM